ncbi:MAG: translation initiation factor [Gemmataceae bacterium]
MTGKVLFTGPRAKEAAALFDGEANTRGWSARATTDLSMMFGASAVVTADSEPAALVAAFIQKTLNPPPPPPPAPTKVKPGTVVRVGRETAGRKGKGVTTVTDLPLRADELQILCTELKNLCGTGGTVKDGVLEIQGDHRDRLMVELEKRGYRPKRAGG